jgi:hypothetical protein
MSCDGWHVMRGIHGDKTQSVNLLIFKLPIFTLQEREHTKNNYNEKSS